MDFPYSTGVAKRRLQATAKCCPDVALIAVKSGKKIERDTRNNLITIFGDVPVTEITDADIMRQVVNPRMRNGRSMGRYLLALLKMFFNWAVDQRVYGLKVNPVHALKTAKLFGSAQPRQRILTDNELRALWIAVNRMPYPTGPFYRTLLLTALRLHEAMRTSRPEWDLRSGEWVIPSERMKGKRAHAVPITDDLRLVAGLFPNGGPFLFSFTSGETPIKSESRIKKAVDKEMLKVLREIAVEEGRDPETVELVPWRTHDIRRTVRSKLSKLRVQHEVKEAILAHAKGTMERTYDVHDYFDEKREALEAWAAELRRIAEPAPTNVVPLRGARPS